MAVTRSTTATYVIPTVNEWYKAAYYNPFSGTYWTGPTRSNELSNVLSSTGTDNANFYYDDRFTDPINDLTPVGYFNGSPGPYGTYDMGGDVRQWDEQIVYGIYRGMRGGAWGGVSQALSSNYTSNSNPNYYDWGSGIRVASVPEPTSIALLLAGGFCLLAHAWRRRSYDGSRGFQPTVGGPHTHFSSRSDD